MKRPTVLLSTILLSTLAPSLLQADDPVQRVLQRYRIPGAAFAVVRPPAAQDGEDARTTVITAGLGRRDIRQPEAPTGDTVFAVASLSKPVFAYGVMLLVQDGALDLDRPLIEYLPEPWADGERAQRITARMVLSHSSGLARRATLPPSVAFEPGSTFAYSNNGYLYLQRVVEHLTGEDLEAWMQRRVLGPLGMTRSSFLWDQRFADDAATPHERRRAREPWRPAEAVAAYTLHSTVWDLGRFLAAVLAPESVPGPLAAEGIALMLTPQIETGEGDTRWTLGWGWVDRGWGPEVYHDGTVAGSEGRIWGMPGRGTGVVVLVNQEGHSGELLEAIVDAITGSGA